MMKFKDAKERYALKIKHRVCTGPYASDNTKGPRVHLRNLYARMNRTIKILLIDHKTNSKSFWAAIKRLQGVRERTRMDRVRDGSA